MNLVYSFKTNIIFSILLYQVFFPIIAHEHYYLIVFNILKGTSVIIDNIDSVETYEEKYKEIYEFVVRNTILVIF